MFKLEINPNVRFFKKNFLARSEVLQSQEMKYTLILKQNETLKQFALIINKRVFFSVVTSLFRKKKNKQNVTSSLEASRLHILGKE